MADYTNFLNCFSFSHGYQMPVEVEVALAKMYQYFLSGKDSASKANGRVYVQAIPQAIQEGLMWGHGSTPTAKMQDSLKLQILYILNNATGYRGEEAREAKQILNDFANVREV